ncbi:hypothetical protein BDY21DRAFT_269656, partial [Lineolata rhizophorae]
HKNKNKISSPNIAQRFESKFWRLNSSDHWLQRWFLEIASWIFSAACMGAILICLFVFDGKPLRQWFLGLSLNAYISVLSRVATSALLHPTSQALGQLKWSWFRKKSKKMWDFEIFDDASRGPWGSVMLIILTKGKALAAGGALIVILSLGLESFFQQVLSVEDHWVPHSFGTVARSVQYNPKSPEIKTEGVTNLFQNRDIESIALPFFTDNGTHPLPFGNGTAPEIPLVCPTNNCTWEPYNSLAVCSSCEDVSQYLHFGCIDGPVDWFNNGTELEVEPGPNRTSCGYFLNSTTDSPVLMSGYALHPNTNTPGEALVMRTFPLTNVFTRRPYYGGSIHFQEIQNPIIDFIWVSTPEGAEGVYDHHPPVAQECVLSWCVKTFQSTYNFGEYVQGEVAPPFYNTTKQPYPWQEPDENDIPDYDGKLEITPPGQNLTFGMTNRTMAEVILVFDDAFPSYQTALGVSGPLQFRYTNQFPPPLTQVLEHNPWEASSNISFHMGRLAHAMTNTVRSFSGEDVVGRAWSSETFVRIRWEWLSLPLFVLFSGLAFLAATIVKSSREKEDVGIWKTSAIPVLLNGLPMHVQDSLNEYLQVVNPRSRAKELRVKLSHRDGWRLS